MLLVAIAIYGPTSVARLAREMVMDPSTLARNLRPLERDGLIERTGGGGNRGRQISLSATGRDTVRDAVPLWRAAQSHFLERFGETAWPDTLVMLSRAVGATRA